MTAADTGRMTSDACGAPRSVHARGLTIQLHEWGEPQRPPLLLLHSLAAHSHWWDWAAPRLAERFHVVAMDFRGHGRSGHVGPFRVPLTPPSYAFTDHVADVVAVLDALGWTAPSVIGHSMGAYVGALLTAQHPDRVGALVIADMLTSWPAGLARHAEQQASRPSAEFTDLAEATSRFRLTPGETIAPPDRLAHLAEASVIERRPGVWQHAFDRQVFLHPPVDPWPFLSKIGAPTLVIHGERSAVMDHDAAQRVAAAVQRGEAAALAGTYHHLVVDDPDGFASLVLDWLGRVDR